MNAAEMTRKAKEAHPEQFCRVARCLWRIKGHDGSPRKPCAKHPVAAPVGHLCTDIDYPPGPGARHPWKATP